MHTKKTNDTNKLIQISYHFALTKIQKLQNFKKKKNKKKQKKKPFSVSVGSPSISRYCPKLAGMVDTWSVFKLVRNVDVLIPIYIPVWY